MAPYCSILAVLSTARTLVIVVLNRVAKLAAIPCWIKFSGGGSFNRGGRRRQSGSAQDIRKKSRFINDRKHTVSTFKYTSLDSSFTVITELMSYVVGKPYLCNLCALDYIPIQRCKWETSALDIRCECPTVTLHRKCPVAPNGAHVSDALSNMEQRMDCQGTSGQPFEIILVIDSAKRIFGQQQ